MSQKLKIASNAKRVFCCAFSVYKKALLVLFASTLLSGCLDVVVDAGAPRDGSAANPPKSAASPEPQQTTNPEHSASIQSGAHLYAEKCQSCHGEQGEGREINGKKYNGLLSCSTCSSLDQLTMRIDLTMPPAGAGVGECKDSCATDIANFMINGYRVDTEPSPVPTTQPTVLPSAGPSSNPTQQPTAIPSAIPTSDPVTVDINRGADLFVVQCAACHGPQGQGVGADNTGSLMQCESCGSHGSLAMEILETMPLGQPSNCGDACAKDVAAFMLNDYQRVVDGGKPSPMPTPIPSVAPSAAPTPLPSVKPSAMPTPVPTPSMQPSVEPVPSPSPEPVGAPIVSFIAPLMNAEVFEGESVFVKAAASDPGGSISHVRLWINDVSVWQEGSAPYEWGLNNEANRNDPLLMNLAAGEYVLRLTATDNTGQTSTVTTTINVKSKASPTPEPTPALTPTPEPTPESTPSPEPILSGADLYELNCESCHKPLAETTKPNKSAQVIAAAIQQVSFMQSIVLTAQEIEAISLALSGEPEPVKPVISFVSPLSTASFVEGDSLQVRVNVESASSPIQHVTLYLNGGLVQVKQVPPYSWGSRYSALNNLQAGSYSLKVIAKNAAGASTELSQSFTVNKDASPTDSNADIQKIMKDGEVNCTNSSCHDTTPGGSRVNLLSGSLEDFAKRLVNKRSTAANCKDELLIDAEDPTNSLLYKLIDPASGQQCMSKMPFGAQGVPTQHLPAFLTWINDIIEVHVEEPEEKPEGPVATVVQSPQTIISKLKYILHGEAISNEELSAVSYSDGSLNEDGLRSTIDNWLNSKQFNDIKLPDFLRLALQQQTSDGQYKAQITPLGRRGAPFGPVLEQIFIKTASRIIGDNEDFRQIVTTNKWEMTTMALSAIAYADRPNIRRGHYFRFFQMAFKYQPSDYTDWRTVTLNSIDGTSPYGVSNESSFKFDEESMLKSFRAIDDGGSIDLAGQRVGFFTTPVFFNQWQTNDDNQFRLNTNQTLIVSLGKTFESGDTSVPKDLSGVDSAHVDPNSDCYGCHKNMDPMRNIFMKHYGPASFRPVERIGNQTAEFAFHGFNKKMNSMYDFANAIAEHPYFATAWTLKLCQWINSAECSAESAEVKRVASVFEGSGFNFKTLVREVAMSSLVTHTDYEQGKGSPGSVVSIARANHYCKALVSRIQQTRDARGLPKYGSDSKHVDLCRDTLAGNIPSDTFGRGVVPFIQATTTDLFLSKTIGTFCMNGRKQVVGAHKATYAFSVNSPENALDDMVRYMLGIPTNADNYQSTRNNLQRLFDVAKKSPKCQSKSELTNALSGDLSCGLAASNSQALEAVWLNVCQSPALTGIGL